MKAFWVLLSMMLMVFTAHAELPETGKDFCKALVSAKGKFKSQSLLRVKVALGEKASLGSQAANATPALEKLGMTDLKKTDAKIAQDLEHIPEGAILVLSKGRRGEPSCRTSPHGHVIIRCGDGFFDNTRNGNISLAEANKRYSGCVRSVMADPRWLPEQKPAAPSEADEAAPAAN